MKKKQLFFIFLLFVLGFNLFGLDPITLSDQTSLKLNGVFRSYFLNDQRIQWSGLEATFGIDGDIASEIIRIFNGGEVKFCTRLFLNQPFEKNILRDEYRIRYEQNFEVDPVEIAELYLQLSTGVFTFGLGKHPTVFGRQYAHHFTNTRIGSPFIRTESILWYETGFFMTCNPGILSIDLGVVNGGKEMDTNSSKAGILRVGLNGERWGLGVSAKFQDGTGSEYQKLYKNHIGGDLMFMLGSFLLSAEVIHDEYGFHREFDEDDVFWKKSLYYRDIFFQYKTPITGIGGYIQCQYEKGKWLIDLNYGEFHPEEIGHIYHDTPTKRGVIKIKYSFLSQFSIYGMALLENVHPREPVFAGSSDYAYMIGFSYVL